MPGKKKSGGKPASPSSDDASSRVNDSTPLTSDDSTGTATRTATLASLGLLGFEHVDAPSTLRDKPLAMRVDLVIRDQAALDAIVKFLDDQKKNVTSLGMLEGQALYYPR